MFIILLFVVLPVTISLYFDDLPSTKISTFSPTIDLDLPLDKVFIVSCKNLSLSFFSESLTSSCNDAAGVPGLLLYIKLYD